jgi:DNA-binding response OmpR family regulator
MNDKPCILLIGDDPPLEYLLERYALQGGYSLQTIHTIGLDTDILQMQPQWIWFSTLDVLEAAQPHRSTILACNAPIVVCSSIADDMRAMDLGADYILLHPLTYERFLSTVVQG